MKTISDAQVLDAVMAFVQAGKQGADMQKAMRAALEAQPQPPEVDQWLPPIERDERMDRTYIPMPGGWEIQTKGKGSTFRICNTKAHERWPVLDETLHRHLEQMALDARASVLGQIAPNPEGV